MEENIEWPIAAARAVGLRDQDAVDFVIKGDIVEYRPKDPQLVKEDWPMHGGCDAENPAFGRHDG